MLIQPAITLPKESATVAINSLARLKIAQGEKIYNLSAGEPQLPTDPLIQQAVIAAMQQGQTLYPPVAGLPELRTQAAQWMNERYGAAFDAAQCLVVNGGKFGIYLLLQLLLSPQSDVLMQAPYWVSYPALVQLFGGNPVIIPTQPHHHWKLSRALLEQYCSPQCRILLLNSASNPTGTVYTREELAELLTFAAEKNLWVIADEVYSELTYDQTDFVSCASFPEHRDRVIIIQSCSKNFAMTGWRVGFVFAPEELIRALTILVGQSTSGVTTVSQWAALSAIRNATQITASIKNAMQTRRNILVDALKRQFQCDIDLPASALYLFLSLQALGVDSLNSIQYCERALQQLNVAMVPGVAFGQEGYVRLSFGGAPEDLVAGIERLKSDLSLIHQAFDRKKFASQLRQARQDLKKGKSVMDELRKEKGKGDSFKSS
ncbi:MAG: aminotransferase class I/II-fold pyridoxal phosphate-dependent enzyme [Gammaproteobacteria bacterium]